MIKRKTAFTLFRGNDKFLENFPIFFLSQFVDKPGKDGKNGDDDDTTSVMSFESSVVSYKTLLV